MFVGYDKIISQVLKQNLTFRSFIPDSAVGGCEVVGVCSSGENTLLSLRCQPSDNSLLAMSRQPSGNPLLALRRQPGENTLLSLRRSTDDKSLLRLGDYPLIFYFHKLRNVNEVGY